MMILQNDPMVDYWTMREYYPYPLELRDHLINERPPIQMPRCYPGGWRLFLLPKYYKNPLLNYLIGKRKDDIIDYLNMYRKWGTF